MGKWRADWNVTGFYSLKEFEKDTGIIETCKDKVQTDANFGLERFTGNKGRSHIFLDSVAKNGETEELRKSAIHGRQLLIK